MKNILHHFFLPQESNNYRARILHNKILLFLILIFFSGGIVMSFVRSSYPSVLGTFSNISNDQLLILTNQKRQENGEPPLSMNSELTQAAINKASDMFTKDYWAHNAPDGTTPWFFIKSAGYNYVYAGENLARGFTTASDVVNAWMASPEHKANMLSPNYKDIGFAVETGKLSGEDTVLIVEMFGSTYLAPPAVAQTQSHPPTVVTPSGSSSAVANTNPGTLGEQKTTPNKQAKAVASSNPGSLQIKPLIDSQSISLTSAEMVLSMLIFVLILDMFVVERKKIVRFVGHNLDHIFFLSLMLVILIILAKGSII